MKFGEQLMCLLTPEWRKQYIDYNRLKKQLYDAVNNAPKEPGLREQHFAKFDERFFLECEGELKKVDLFYHYRLEESQGKLYEISVDLERWKSMPQKSGEDEKLRIKTKDHLKFAFSEFYLSLTLLQKYQAQNATGFRKILKKRDKLIGNSKGMEWRATHELTAKYNDNEELKKMFHTVEHSFIYDLESGDRSEAMKRLRVPPLEEKLSPWTTFRVGFFGGSFAILSMIILITLVSRAYVVDEPRWLGVRLFRGLFIVGLNVVLIGINMYGWSKAGVNHVLIFEIDPRHHLTYQHMMEVGFMFLTFWAWAVLGFLYGPMMGLPSLIFPPILMGLLFLWMIYPLKWPRFMIRSSRLWFLRHLFHCLTPCFHFVRFPDFWLADQMNSLVTMFLDLEYFVCFYASEVEYSPLRAIPYSNVTRSGIDYASGKDVCHSNVHGIRPLVALIPALIRFLQCLRRYRDIRTVHPHVTNALKYASILFVVFFGALSTWYTAENAITSDESPFFYFWLVAYVISFAYTYVWDVKMDFGLFALDAPRKHKFLRSELVYSRRWYYYAAILGDCVLRLSWVLNVSLGDAWTPLTDALLCFTGPLECFRRFMWNFFRLENEHLNNCGRFRAVRDINIKPLQFYREEEETLRTILDEEGAAHDGSQLSIRVSEKVSKEKNSTSLR